MQKTDLYHSISRHAPRAILVVATLVVVSIAGTVASGQGPFSAPPPPQTAPSAVRGIAASSPQTITSPANVAPPTASPVTTPPTPSPITPTATSGPLPIEGGEIVARIDGQIVLASDVLWQVDQLIEANRDRIPPDQIKLAKRTLLRQQVLGLIDTKMLYADFRRKVPAENLPSITENLQKPFEEGEIPRLIKMLDIKDRNELVQVLEDSGTSLRDLRRQFNERTIAGEWLRQMTPKPKEVTHDQMLDYYSEHKADFEFPARVQWEEVMISFSRSNNDRTAAWQAITSLGNEVWQCVAKQPNLRGPIFTEIAKKESHGFTSQAGGQHDWTTQGALRSKAIDQQLFTLKVGQLSKVIESERGFHIIRVLDRNQAGRTPFTEAQADIRKALKKDQQKGLAMKEVAKLRKRSRVWTVFDGNLTGPQLSQKNTPKQRR